MNCHCQHCGTEFPGRIGTKFCKDECRRAAEKIKRRKERPETECLICFERFIPSRHGQRNCSDCTKKSDDLSLRFRRWLRKEHLTRRKLRAGRTRGIPRIQDATLPALADQWRSSERFKDYLHRLKWGKGAKTDDPFLSVKWPDPKAGWTAIPQTTAAQPAVCYQCTEKNRDARLATMVWRAIYYPFKRSDANKPTYSERVHKNDVNETRAKLERCVHGMPAKWCALCLDKLLGDVICHPTTNTQPINGDYDDETELYTEEHEPEVPGQPDPPVEGENY